MTFRKLLLTASCIFGLCALEAHSETIVLPAVADTTLIQTAPSNNLGHATFVNAGTTQNSNYNRGLFKFDVTPVPAGSRVTAVRVILEVTHQPQDGFAPSPFALHRVLWPWGEGDKINPVISPGQGQPASANEATWVDRFAFTTNIWSSPGGAPGTDYAATVSANQFIYGVSDSPYTFDTTAELVADVKTWLTNPDLNFGWLLKSQAETVIFTARRFGSREDTNAAPRLEVDYLPPPVIKDTAISGSQFFFSFLADAGAPYRVEFENSVSTPSNWNTFTNISSQPFATNIVIADTVAAPQRYYRVVAP